MRLTSRIALITGAAQGIGAACARRFALEGASVMLVDIDEAAGSALARTLSDEGHRAAFVRADVSSKSEVDAAVAATVARFARIDILVNNAGITHAAEFLEVEENDFDRVIAVNLKSMFLMEPGRRSANGEAIVAGQAYRRDRQHIVGECGITIPNQVPYVISKGGVNQLTKVSAIALAPYNIRVNAISPGTILTDMARKAVLTNDEARRKILSRSPLGRCGEPEEIAAVAVFLASDDASYMSGQTIYPDGGRLALNYTVPVAD
jgi:NAD(P)-dependent dehydrogenase (short-subunit alcohol dehydrogenase family)